MISNTGASSQKTLEDKKHSLSENLISIDKENEKFKAVREEYKAKVKPLAETNKILLLELREKEEKIKGNCFVFRDFDDGTVDTYNEEGVCVESRRMRPSEKQKTIQMAIREGTNG